MYTEFYGLKEKPFTLEPNARYIYLSEAHQEGLATLVYAVEEREGWALMLGEAGVGKTTLIMALLRELGESVIPAVVANPNLPPLDFFNVLALELGLEGPFKTKGEFLVALAKVIRTAHAQGKSLLIVVDEAQSMPADLIEELRLLANLDTFSPRVINIFLVGQPQLLKHLKALATASLLQSLRRVYRIKPLDLADTIGYVRFRLKVAGATREIFTDDALKVVWKLSKGVPRLINALCDSAMVLGFAQGQPEITPRLVVEGAKDIPYIVWPEEDERPQRPSEQPSYQAQEPEAAEQPRVEPQVVVEPQPQAAPAPEPSAPAAPPPRQERGAERAEPTQEARPGMLKRFLRSLSRESPGSFWRRLLVLIIVAAMLWGGYHLARELWWRYGPRKARPVPQLYIPPPPPPPPGKGQ